MFELWDFETGNAIGEYDSLADALQVIRDAVGRNGEATLDGLALLETDPNGEDRLVAKDRELLPFIQSPTATG